jgi:hypothetical protein
MIERLIAGCDTTALEVPTRKEEVDQPAFAVSVGTSVLGYSIACTTGVSWRLGLSLTWKL